MTFSIRQFSTLRSLGLWLPLLVASTAALGHTIPGVKPIDPGQAFSIATFRGLRRGDDGHFRKDAIDLLAARDGSALVFLVIDPRSKRDVREAKRFEKLLKSLPNTHGFLVVPPGLSLLPDSMKLALDADGLELATILDDRGIFPYVFKHKPNETPLYELFDRAQTLLLENASYLVQKIPSGETVSSLMQRLDRGEQIAPLALKSEPQPEDTTRE